MDVSVLDIGTAIDVALCGLYDISQFRPLHCCARIRSPGLPPLSLPGASRVRWATDFAWWPYTVDQTPI